MPRGQSGFKEWVYEKLLTDKSAEEKTRIIKPLTPMHVVVDCVVKYYNVDADKIRKKIEKNRKIYKNIQRHPS